MALSKTPGMNDLARLQYEVAVATGDHIRQLTIELDTVIEHATQAFPKEPANRLLLAQEVDNFAQEVMRDAKTDHTADFTDWHRLMSNAQFAVEKIALPFFFSSDDPDFQQLRTSLANGSLGKSVSLIQKLLAYYDTQPETLELARGHLRGALQEQTALALFNYPQDGRLIAVPTGFDDDVYHHTDLEVHFITDDGVGYRQPVSIKSSYVSAKEEKQRHPHLAVLSAADFNNSQYRTSRLLVREDSGYPGITDAEHTLILKSRKKLLSALREQMPHTAAERPYAIGHHAVKANRSRA